MSRHLSIAYAMLIFAIVSVGAGCADTASTTPLVNSAAEHMRLVHQTVGSWTRKSPMIQRRNQFGAGVVDGIVIVAGGYNVRGQITVEAYDPSTNTWTAKAPMHPKRTDLAAGVVNGILYAVGGYHYQKLATNES